MLSAFLPGSMSGREPMRAESLRKATIEPVKVTPPMKTPMNTSAWWMSRSEPLSSEAARCPFQPTSTAASPTKECRSAMSSGIPVISTTRARHRPIAPPASTATASRVSPNPPCGTREPVAATTHTVEASAIAMPAMPNATPRRAVSCALRPARLRMKSSAATM